MNCKLWKSISRGLKYRIKWKTSDFPYIQAYRWNDNSKRYFAKGGCWKNILKYYIFHRNIPYGIILAFFKKSFIRILSITSSNFTIFCYFSKSRSDRYLWLCSLTSVTMKLHPFSSLNNFLMRKLLGVKIWS